MPEAYESLDSLRDMLQVRRQALMEKIANGLEKEADYRVHVGRCKELENTIEKISDQIKSLNGGDSDDDANGKQKRPAK